MANINKVSVGGTTYDIEDTVARTDIIELKGTTRNMFSVSDIVYGKNWSGGNNTSRAVIAIPVLSSTKYTLTLSNRTGFNSIILFQKVNSTDTSAIKSTEMSGTSLTITTEATTQYVTIQFDKANISKSDFENKDIQFEQGDATSFIPHVSAVDYVARESTDSLEERTDFLEQFVTTTRNLLNVEDTIYGKDWSLGNNSGRAICPIEVEGSKTYTFSLQDKTGFNSVILYEKATYSAVNSVASHTIAGKVLTFTTKSNCTWLFVQYDKTSITSSDVIATKSQFEIGEAVSEYIEHYSAQDDVAREDAEIRVQKNMDDPIFYTSAETMKDIVNCIKSWKDNHDKLFYGGNLDLNKPTVITAENYTEVENATIADIGKYLVSCSTFGNMILRGVSFASSVCAYQTVSQSSAMTDTSKIYRYYGTEAGYTDDYYEYKNGAWTVTSVENKPYYPYGYKVLADTSKYAKKYDEPTDRLYAWSLAEYGYDMGYGFVPGDYSQCRTGDLMFELNEGNHAGDGKWFNIYHIGIFLRKNQDESITVAEISDWATDTAYNVHTYAPVFISTFPKGSNLYNYFSKFAVRFHYGISKSEYDEVGDYITTNLI